MLDVYVKEYEKLKAEQIQRIGFRDNMLYVTLGAVGAVASWAVSRPEHFYALFIVPWVCVVLGWTYLVNDEKISAIGRYIREVLVPRIREAAAVPPGREVFEWEWAHRRDAARPLRERIQFVVDELTFVISGLAALGAALRWGWPLWWPALVLALAEAAMLGVLGWQVWLYADLDSELSGSPASDPVAPGSESPTGGKV